MTCQPGGCEFHFHRLRPCFCCLDRGRAASNVRVHDCISSKATMLVISSTNIKVKLGSLEQRLLTGNAHKCESCLWDLDLYLHPHSWSVASAKPADTSRFADQIVMWSDEMVELGTILAECLIHMCQSDGRPEPRCHLRSSCLRCHLRQLVQRCTFLSTISMWQTH